MALNFDDLVKGYQSALEKGGEEFAVQTAEGSVIEMIYSAIREDEIRTVEINTRQFDVTWSLIESGLRSSIVSEK